MLYSKGKVIEDRPNYAIFVLQIRSPTKLFSSCNGYFPFFANKLGRFIVFVCIFYQLTNTQAPEQKSESEVITRWVGLAHDLRFNLVSTFFLVDTEEEWEAELEGELNEFEVVSSKEGSPQNAEWENEIQNMLDAEESGK